MSQPILQVEHLKKYFPAGGRKVLRAVDDVSFSVQEGEILGIVGESGCGKTTCGRTAIGLYSKTDGVSLYRGEDVHQMRGAKRRAFCCQVQTVFQCIQTNRIDDFIDECKHQKQACFFLRYSACTHIEQSILVQLPHSCPVRAFHIVRIDFKLRLRVHTRIACGTEVAVGLLRICMLGIRTYQYQSGKSTGRLVIKHVLE